MLNSDIAGASTFVLPLSPLSDILGVRMAPSGQRGLTVNAKAKLSTESRSAQGQKPVLRALSDRTIHSTMSPGK